MTLILDLAPEIEDKLEERARASGKNVQDYVVDLISHELNLPNDRLGAEREMSIDDILEPFRKGFHESGITQEEIAFLLDSELEDVRSKRRAMQSK